MEELVDYLADIVEPTLAEFELHPGSRRHGFLACVATFHAVDYLAYPRKSAGLRQKWRRESRDFAIVDEVAHAFKHVVTPSVGNPRLKAADVRWRPPAQWGSAAWGYSRWSGPDGGVEVEGVDEDLLNVVRRAVAFLQSLPVTGTPK
jgi:hypothetical protein